MDNLTLVKLYQRQPELDAQVNLPEIQVFDYRTIAPLSEASAQRSWIAAGCDKKEVWCITNGDLEIPAYLKVPEQSSDKPYVISGWFDSGTFFYSASGSHETDPEYVALRVAESEIERTKQRLVRKGAQKIVCGKEVNILNTIHFLKEKRFRRLHRGSPITQMKILEELL